MLQFDCAGQHTSPLIIVPYQPSDHKYESESYREDGFEYSVDALDGDSLI